MSLSFDCFRLWEPIKLAIIKFPEWITIISMFERSLVKQANVKYNID